MRTIAIRPKAGVAEGLEVKPLPASKTLNQQTYVALREDILSGRLVAGAKLPFAELHKRYDVGTGTLREALARLVSDNLVIGEGQKGFRVAPMSREDLEDITALRCQLEAEALRDSIEHGDDTWEAHVLGIYHRLSRVHQRSKEGPPLLGVEGAMLHRAFHLVLFEKDSSPWRRRLTELLYDHSERYRRLSSIKQSPERDSDGEHRAIVQAILSHKAREASELLVEHICRTTRELTGKKGIFSAKPP